MKAEELTHLIGTLSKSENTLLQKYISNKYKLKYLYKSLENGVSDQDICMTLYKQSPGNKYYQLKSRLLHLLLKALAVSNSNIHFTTKAHTNKQNVRQHIIDSEILYSRGLSLEGDRILKKAEAIGKKYQYYAELYTIYDLMLKHKGKRSSIDYFEKTQTKKVEALQRLNTLSEATYEYSKLMLPDYRKKSSIYENDVYSALKKLELLKEDDLLDEVKSMAYRANAYYNHINGRYDDALESALMFKNLVRASPILNSNSNIAGASMQLANIYILKGEYKKSVKEVNIALRYFVKNSLNELNALNIRFVSGFVGLDKKLMKETIDIASSNPLIKKSKFYKGLWEIRKAQLLYRNNSIDECTKLINNSSALSSNEFAWRPGLDLFLVFLFIISGDIDVAEYRLRALRRKFNNKLNDKRSQSFWTYKLLLSSIRQDGKIKSESEELIVYDPFDYDIISIFEMRSRIMELN